MSENIDEKYSLTEGPIVRSLVRLAVPIMFMNILQAAYQFIDTFWVGRLGGNALASVSVGFPIFTLLIALGTGLAVAGSVLVAQYYGARNQRMVNHVSAQTFLMIIVISLVFSVIGYVLTPYIFHLMHIQANIFPVAVKFLRISILGLVFAFVFAIFQAVMRDIGQVKLPMYVVLGTVLLNFFLDPIFIFGFGPIPATGAVGAAFATFITQFLAAAVGLVILFHGKYGIHIKLKDFIPDFAFIKKAFFLGLPASIDQSLRAFSGAILMFLISSFGTISIAAYGVGSNVLDLVIIPAMGLSLATTTMVAQNVGAKKYKRAGHIAHLSAWISLFLFTAIGVLCYIFAKSIVKFFVPSDLATIQAAVLYVRIISISFGFMGVQLALSSVFRASGNFLLIMILSIISSWVLQIPLSFLLSKYTGLGVLGIWWAVPITNLVMTGVTIVLFIKGNWKKRRITEDEKSVEKVMEIEAK